MGSRQLVWIKLFISRRSTAISRIEVLPTPYRSGVEKISMRPECILLNGAWNRLLLHLVNWMLLSVNAIFLIESDDTSHKRLLRALNILTS